MNFPIMAVHIGKIIKKLVKSRGISVTDFAGRINYSRRNTYEIFNKATIDTGLLIKINQILDENLFLRYIKESDILQLKSPSLSDELTESVKDLKAEIKKLQDLNNPSVKQKIKKSK